MKKKIKKIYDKDGYIYYLIYDDNGKVRNKRAHRLVAECFISKEIGLEVNHIDHNKQNNYYKNLEWVTSSENSIKYIQNLIKQNKSLNHHKSSIVLNLETGIYYESVREASICTGINYQTFLDQLNGRNKNKTNFIKT